METKHTPGKWIVRMTASGNPFIYEDATGKNIAGIAGTRPGIDAEESQANAALIAQAPDLLAERDRLAAVNAELVAALGLALASAVPLDSRIASAMAGDDVIETWAAWVMKARAVLTKAKGE